MNTRITCLLLFVIAHASAIAAPKFPLTLYASHEQFYKGKFSSQVSVNVLTWSPDKKTLASYGLETTFDAKDNPEGSILKLFLWDAVNWGRKPKRKILVNVGDYTSELDFFDHKDSNRLALHSRAGYGILHLERPKDKPKIIIAPELKLLHTHSVPGAIWSRDGKKVAFNVRAPMTSISIFDEFGGKALHTMNSRAARDILKPGRSNFGVIVDWSPDGKYLLSNAFKSLIIFDEKLEEELFRFDPFGPKPGPNTGHIVTVKWSPNGKEIAFGMGKHEVGFLDLKGLEENEDPIGAPSRYKNGLEEVPDRVIKIKSNGMLAWGPQGRRIAVVGSIRENLRGGAFQLNPALYIYNKGGDLLHEFAINNVFEHPKNRRGGDLRTIRSLEWSPDGFMIAAGLGDGTIRVFKTPK